MQFTKTQRLITNIMLIIKNATFKAQFNYIKKALKIKHWQQ